ncbi:hypothetical protein Tco_0515210 [Tanacetum coccineum]
MEGTVDITEFFRKLKSVCHWANPSKDLKWSNVPRVKLSSLSKSDDTFPSLQALSNLYYLLVVSWIISGPVSWTSLTSAHQIGD